VIVARSYVRQIAMSNVLDPNNPAAQSQPDDYTPRDHMGHGTAVASAAAGNQITGPGAASGGGNIAFSGMAPKAYLGNYKLWGTPGVNDGWGASEDAMIQALSDALTDGMDVVTTSLGESPALGGALDTGAACNQPTGTQCDPLAYAFEMAAQKGMVITVAAGNSGSDASLIFGENYPYFNSISSPATAPSVIGVGATLNSHAFNPSVSVIASTAPSNLHNIPGQFTDAYFSPSTNGANFAPLIDVAKVSSDAYACSALPANSLTGAYALIERGPASSPCAFSTKADNAQAAGATGIVFYMYDSSAPIAVGGLNFVGPALMISNSDGTNLKNYIDTNPGQTVSIDAAGAETELATYDSQQQLALAQNQLASYSSFGPTPDGLIKPDLAATGGLDPDIVFSSGMYLAAQNYDPNGDLYSMNRYAAADGTSFATPLTAGAAALVKQAHPGYTAAQVKSALVNFSAQDTTTDDGNVDLLTGNVNSPQTITPQWIGAGRLDAGAAIKATASVQPATLSFGYLKTGTTLPLTQTLTITNQGPQSQTFSVLVPLQKASATVLVDHSSLAIAAGDSATLKVSLSGTVPPPGSYTGQITLQSPGTSGLSLHVPYMFLVGDGVPYNVMPLVGGEGIPGQDIGPGLVQVVDQYGVPVPGAAVTFTAKTGSLTFSSCSLNNCGFAPPACTGSGTSSVTCNTDNYGFAYADTVLGSSTGSPTINVRAGSLFLPAVAEAAILPQPALTQGQVLNNASFQPSVAPGSIVAIKGANLMNSAELLNTDLGYDQSTTSPYPVVLDGVNVSFDIPGANISVPAPIVAVSPGQINVQVPWEVAGQTSAQVKVIVDELIYSNVVTATLANYTPAFFTNSGNIADAEDTNYHVITTSNPAVRGQYIQLFANGLGPVNNPPADGAPAPGATSTTTTPCSVSIGGQQVTPAFCGLAPGFTVYQVNVQVPANLSAGNQPITITVGAQTSPSGVMIPVQ
jgi:uncharacterized protein (TIGR03437 family)